MCLWILYDAAIVEGLCPVSRGSQEQERVRLVSVGSQHSAQGEVGANISVEHEEGLRAPSQDLIPEVVETTSCAQRGKFLQVPVPRDPRASSVSQRSQIP